MNYNNMNTIKLNTAEQRLHKIVAWIVIGMGVFFAFSYFYKRYLWAEFPDGDFLFNREDAFMDFFNVNQMISGFDPYAGYGSSYPPVILLIAYIFSLFGPYRDMKALDVSRMLVPRVSYAVMFIGCTMAICWIMYLILKRYIDNKKVLVVSIPLLMCSAPYLFLADRGNYLLVCLIFIMLFVYYYDTKPGVAAVMLGAAAAIKIYPIFLFLVYILKKRWKELGIATLTGAVLTFLPLFFFKGGFFLNLKEMLYAIAGFANGAEDTCIPATYYSVGLTSLLYLPFTWFHEGIKPEHNPIMIIYLVIGSGLALWSLWNLRKEEDEHKILSLLTVLMVFLIPNSYMYNLTYLFIPIMYWIMEEKKEISKADWVYGSVLAVLMIAKAYYYPVNYTHTSIAVLIDGLLLLGIIIAYNCRCCRKKKIRE